MFPMMLKSLVTQIAIIKQSKFMSPEVKFRIPNCKLLNSNPSISITQENPINKAVCGFAKRQRQREREREREKERERERERERVITITSHNEMG